jgi:hypothetical protein
MALRPSQAEQVLETLVEDLAAIEHQRWAHWQHYMHDKGERRPDGSPVLPADLVRHWDTQIDTGYADLSESEKMSDREQVRRYLPLIAAALAERGSRG